ncbi:MAG: M23 family metallopeptidase [Candidatus Margulisbacteria bacterium]|nr:M23 family metallopeptidase [Candidatus Margulisiibacteriota bacterium]
MFKLILCLTTAFIIYAASYANEASMVTLPSIAWQGKAIVIYLPKWHGQVISGKFLGQTFKIYDNQINFIGIIGVPIDAQIGSQPIYISYMEYGITKEAIYNIPVAKTKFAAARFYLPSQKNKLRSRKIIDNEWPQIERALLKESDERLWNGKFVLPANGPISMAFGQREIINGAAAGSHRGVDLAVVSGSKVFVPNNGTVVFVKKLKAFGNTIVIDHGHGLFTLYFHLSNSLVKVGQTIPKGQIIALSGNSGISSGPHLHWGMSVHNLRVDPMQWVNNEM